MVMWKIGGHTGDRINVNIGHGAFGRLNRSRKVLGKMLCIFGFKNVALVFHISVIGVTYDPTVISVFYPEIWRLNPFNSVFQGLLQSPVCCEYEV